MVQGDWLRTGSVGFRPQDWEVLRDPETNQFTGYNFKKQELLEFSIVTVPANPEALVSAKAAGINLKPLRNDYSKHIDTWDRSPLGLLVPRASIEQAWKATGETIVRGANLEGDNAGSDRSRDGGGSVGDARHQRSGNAGDGSSSVDASGEGESLGREELEAPSRVRADRGGRRPGNDGSEGGDELHRSAGGDDGAQASGTVTTVGAGEDSICAGGGGSGGAVTAADADGDLAEPGDAVDGGSGGGDDSANDAAGGGEAVADVSSGTGDTEVDGVGSVDGPGEAGGSEAEVGSADEAKASPSSIRKAIRRTIGGTTHVFDGLDGFYIGFIDKAGRLSVDKAAQNRMADRNLEAIKAHEELRARIAKRSAISAEPPTVTNSRKRAELTLRRHALV